MANCYWPEEYYGSCWSSDSLDKDDSILFGQSADDQAAVALQYNFYNSPATATKPLWADRSIAGASRSHSEAEKRRRDRINAQLATLRKLIPKSDKMDKAALLGHVVEHVKEQSRKAKEMSKFSTIPTEIDEITIDHHFNIEEATSENNVNKNNNIIYLKASICCDDRPELFVELNNAIKGLGLAIVQAEITSIGGRTKSNFVLMRSTDEQTTYSSSSSLRQSLKLVLSRVVISSGASTYSVRSKRQRFFYPSYC